MKFTFGIITGNDIQISKMVNSINANNIPEYEIIIVGGNGYDDPHVKHIPFDDTIRERWITKKKNLITKNAKYDNIVFMHDYVALDQNWYKGFLEFGDDWDICMNVILNADGIRFRDWTLWPSSIENLDIDRSRCLLPYDVDWMQSYMYISGAYWVAKKHVMEAEPLDERLLWGESEDVEWSFRIRDKYKYVMNPLSTVKLIKRKDRKFGECIGKDMRIIRRLK